MRLKLKRKYLYQEQYKGYIKNIYRWNWHFFPWNMVYVYYSVNKRQKITKILSNDRSDYEVVFLLRHNKDTLHVVTFSLRLTLCKAAKHSWQH
jgi:hypothetical protein